MRKIYFLTIGCILSAALWISCSKKSSSAPAPAATTGTTGISANSIYASGNIDGVSFSYIDGKNSVVQGTSYGSTGDGHGQTLSQYYGYLQDTVTKQYLFKIGKGTLVTTGSAGDEDVNPFFATGSYPYSSYTGKDSLNGICIKYYDAQHNEWASNNAPAKQDGSNFTIISKETQQFGYYLKISATFNCKVYNATGQSKTITNGKLSLFVY